MYYNPYNEKRNQSYDAQYLTFVDPFVVKRLQSVVGKDLVVETTKDTIRGVLVEVQPDHIALSAGGDSTFFVRIQQIVSIMPV